MPHDRRTVLTALGLAVPFGIPSRLGAAPAGPAPVLRLRSFEEGVRDAFRSADPLPRRVEVGHSDLIAAGVQGCHNDRPFAGFPAGHLRIVRCGSEPGPVVHGVRLYVATVDVVLTGGRTAGSRPLDFASLPPAPVFTDDRPDDERSTAVPRAGRSATRSPKA